jgi:hypothetical protein
MSSRNLFEPITDNGIQNTNFFNGRLLTADDLTAVIAAGRDHDRQLGRAVGEGVVYGLEVELASSSTTTQPVVRVAGGLALNRRGAPVALNVPTVDVALVKSATAVPADAGLFAECEGPAPTDNLSNLGVYVFVATPASAFEGSVPMRHSVTSDKVDRCGRRFAVEGVKFRTERIDFTKLTGLSTATRTLLGSLVVKTDEASVSKLRNVIAHLCFDSETETGLRRDPFVKTEGNTNFINYGALAELRASGQLTDCDVPLAVIYWSAQGVRFVDAWAARRLARRQLEFDVLSLLRGYGYERLLQFQRQLQELFDKLGALTTLQLQNYFAFVPPVGFFPVTGAKSPRGFSTTNFFKQFTTATSTAGDITAERFGALLLESFTGPAAALSSKPTFELYRVRDNSAAVSANASTQLQLAFVSRTLQGPLARDGVANVFYDAWEAYRGIIKRRLFILPFDDDDYLGANFGIVAAVNDVLFMSNREYTLAAGRHLDAGEAIKSFADLLRVQKDFVQFLLKGIPFPDRSGDRSGDRDDFARQLAKLLAKLAAAVGASDLPAAVVMQDIINKFIRGWEGDGIVIGTFGATWLASSPGGRNLIPAQGPFEHHFLVANATDRSLSIGLAAAVAPAQQGETLKGDWSDSLSVEFNGKAAKAVTIASGDTQLVSVFVNPPREAEFGKQVVLTLRTSVGGATNKTKEGSVTLDIESATAVSAPHTVRIEKVGTPPLRETEAARSATSYTWVADVLYTKSQSGPQTTKFRMVVSLTANMSEGWQVQIIDSSSSTTQPPGTAGVFVREFELTSGVNRQIPVTILTPTLQSPQQRTAQFGLRVESIALAPSANDTHDDTFDIRVRAGG